MKKKQTNCDYCAYYVYDEEEDYYYCEVNLDEDEMMHFMSSATFNCPYFRDGDEYAVVRKQN